MGDANRTYARAVHKKVLRRMVYGLAAVVCVCLAWYALNRVLSPWRAVRRRAASGPGATPPPFHGRLRICCFNIAHGRGTAKSNWQGGDRAARLDRLRRIARTLKEQSLDIIILNEVDFDSVWSHGVNQAEFLAREAGFPYWVEQRNIDAALPFVSVRCGNALLSRYPVEKAQVVDFPGHAAWETVLAGKKRGLMCTVRLTEERRLCVLAVHLDHRREAVRLQGARRIDDARKLSSMSFVAAGDFNSTPVGFPYAASSSETALTWLLNTGAYNTSPLEDPDHSDMTFSTMEPTSVIDWILVPGTWQIASRTALPADLSDHRPVVMEVHLDKAGGEGVR